MQKKIFSIIIPTYNRPEKLVECLESINFLDYSHEYFEVIVVDDGSQTPLDAVITSFSKFKLTLLRQTNAGPASARNRGAMCAEGKFLVFTDDDCLLVPNFLTTLAARFNATPDTMIGGCTLNALPENIYSTASQLLIDYLYTYYNESKQLSFFTSNNLALPAEYFHILGGFDTSFPLAAAEDREFCDRWLNSGYKMIYAPEVKIYHAHKLTLLTFWHQHFNYGRGAFCFRKLKSHRQAEHIKVEPLSFYVNLLTYPLSQSFSKSALIITGLFCLSQIANIVGFFWEIFRNQNQGK